MGCHAGLGHGSGTFALATAGGTHLIHKTGTSDYSPKDGSTVNDVGIILCRTVIPCSSAS